MILDTSFITSWVKDGVQYGPPSSKDEMITANFLSMLNSSFSFYHNVNPILDGTSVHSQVIFLSHLLSSFTMSEIITDSLVVMENKIPEIKQKVIDSPTKIEDFTTVFDNDMRYFELASFVTDKLSLINAYEQAYETFLNNYENGQTNNKNTILEELVQAQFIVDTPENRTKLSNLLDKSKLELHNEYQKNKEKAQGIITILQEILELNEQKPQNITDTNDSSEQEDISSTDNPDTDPSIDNKQNNILPNTGNNSIVQKENKMPVLTSDPKYTTLKTELNATLTNFVKNNPDSVKYTKSDSGKSQITLFFGQVRDVEMKKLATICMDTLNDNDFVIDGIPANVVKASESYIVFEGETAAVETAIKTKVNDYPILAIKTSQTEDFDVDDLVTKIKNTIITALVKNRGDVINYSYLFDGSGIEVIDNRTTGRVIINFDRIEKFLRMMKDRGTLSFDSVNEGDPGYDYASIVEVVETVKDVTLTILRMKNKNKDLLIGDFTTKLEAEKIGLERVHEDSVTFTYDVETYSELRQWFPIKNEETDKPTEEETPPGDGQDDSGDVDPSGDGQDDSQTTVGTDDSEQQTSDVGDAQEDGSDVTG